MQAKCLRKGSGYFAPSLPFGNHQLSFLQTITAPPLSLLVHIHASYPVEAVS